MLPVDVFFRPRSRRQRADEFEDVLRRRGPLLDRAHGHLDLTVERVDGLIQIDVLPAKTSATTALRSMSEI